MNRQKSREILDNVLSGTKAGFKSILNLVYNQKAERSTMSRQKSRRIVENVLSGTKAGFKAILNFEHLIERNKMDHQKSKSTFSAILLTLTLMVTAFWVSPAVAQKYVTDPSTGKVVTQPEYGGTLTQAVVVFPPSCSNWWNLGWSNHLHSGVIERLAFADWAKSREIWDGRVYVVQTPEMSRGNLAESWSMPDATTWIWNIRKGVNWHDKAPMAGRQFDAKDVEWNYHRYFGMGEFKEDGPNAGMGGITYGMDIASVKATDQWTIEIKLNKPDIDMPGKMLNNYFFVHAPSKSRNTVTLRIVRPWSAPGPLSWMKWSKAVRQPGRRIPNTGLRTKNSGTVCPILTS